MWTQPNTTCSWELTAIPKDTQPGSILKFPISLQTKRSNSILWIMVKDIYCTKMGWLPMCIEGVRVNGLRKEFQLLIREKVLGTKKPKRFCLRVWVLSMTSKILRMYILPIASLIPTLIYFIGLNILNKSAHILSKLNMGVNRQGDCRYLE